MEDSQKASKEGGLSNFLNQRQTAKLNSSLVDPNAQNLMNMIKIVNRGAKKQGGNENYGTADNILSGISWIKAQNKLSSQQELMPHRQT